MVCTHIGSNSLKTVLSLFILAIMPNALVAAERITVEHDEAMFVSTIRVRSTNGRVAWTDVLRGLARAKGFDDEALAGVWPDASFDLTTLVARLQFAAYNVVLKPDVQFAVEYDDLTPQNPQLVIQLNREGLLASKRRIKSWLRQKVMSLLDSEDSNSRERFGISLPDGWQLQSPDRPLVIAIHGLNSDGQEACWLLTQPKEKGFACASFNYPNDQPIRESAILLSDELQRIAKESPNRQVALVTHSMGGLVARAVIEDENLDPRNVSQLIMVAPPNHGSILAHFAFGLDIFEYTANPNRRDKARKFYAAMEDGFCEAAVDLQPDSLFLRRLNAQTRNKDVTYSIILGTDAPLTDDNLAAMHTKLTQVGTKSRWAQFFGAKLGPWLEDLDEVVQQRGDGAVAVKRGRLEGVTDVLLLPFGHTDVLAAPKTDEMKSIHNEVMRRLGN